MIVNHFTKKSQQKEGLVIYTFEIPIYHKNKKLYKLTVPFQQKENPQEDIELDFFMDISRDFEKDAVYTNQMYNYNDEVHSHYR